MGRATTPASTLFDLMKRFYGISHKELASLVLSGRPLSDGRSPASRVDDRTWVSRFVVHARPEELQPEFFGDFSVSALRIIARMKSQRKGAFTGAQIFAFVCGEGARAMEAALTSAGQPFAPYRALLDRIRADESLTVDERAEAAMVLMVSAGCTCDVGRAVEEARAFAQSVHGNGLGTPPSEMLASLDDIVTPDADTSMEKVPPAPWLGLLQLNDGLVVGGAHWIAPDGEGAVIGSLATAKGEVCAVASDVSGRHARIWRDGNGVWLVEDMASCNGTALTSALSGERVELSVGNPITLQPGDQLHLGTATTFAVIEGLPA